jgi:uncharacterized Zn finger protein (UPF0148 family)
MCDDTASLSRADTRLIIDAARERRRRGMPTQWTRAEKVLPASAPTDDPSVEDVPEPPDPAVSPRIECRRCGTGFVCEWPELSGAVHCPVCDGTASLSSSDTQLVVDAARERRRRFLPTKWTRAEMVLRPHADAGEEEIREILRLQARQIRRNADRLCPRCLYDVEGLFDDWNDVKPCPECAERISPRLVVERWIDRSRQAHRYALVAGWGGIVAGLLFPPVVLIIGLVFGGMLRSGLFALLIIGVLVLCATVIVYRNAFAWMRLRDPIAPRLKIAGMALGITAANAVGAIVVASLFGLMLTQVLLPY